MQDFPKFLILADGSNETNSRMDVNTFSAIVNETLISDNCSFDDWYLL